MGTLAGQFRTDLVNWIPPHGEFSCRRGCHLLPYQLDVNLFTGRDQLDVNLFTGRDQLDVNLFTGRDQLDVNLFTLYQVRSSRSTKSVKE